MHDIGLILTITAGLSFALIFGVITNRLGLSPIVGYLLAGIAVGPYTPGFVADSKLATQLAEIGVILLMFGVGLHFKLSDLMAVRKIALPGAIVQSAVATGLGALAAVIFGWNLSAGVVLGIAISVASTVVLIRVLQDNNMLETRHGHVAVGWLVVEDIFTVLVLVLLPAIFTGQNGAEHGGAHGAGQGSILESFGMAVLKLSILISLVLIGGGKVIPALLNFVARMRSRELFTLTVLVVALGIATGSAVVFGASMALGAFLAGMIVGQSEVHHQAAADALPMRDAFAVLFFVSVGMLFDPMFIINHPGLVLVTLGIIMLGKPAAALFIVLVLGYPVRTGLTVAIGLAQVGEFSFILGDLGKQLKILPTEGYSVLVAGALLSITINPILFRNLDRLERAMQNRPALWRFLNRRNKDFVDMPEVAQQKQADITKTRAIVVGFGPVGKTLTKILSDFQIRPIIIEMNVDTVKKLNAEGYTAIYGDAGRREILEAAEIASARYLLVTLPDLAGRFPVIATAKLLNPNVTVLSRARYIGEREMLEEGGASGVAYEEVEVAVELAQLLLNQVGASDDEIERELTHVRAQILPQHV